MKFFKLFIFLMVLISGAGCKLNREIKEKKLLPENLANDCQSQSLDLDCRLYFECYEYSKNSEFLSLKMEFREKLENCLKVELPKNNKQAHNIAINYVERQYNFYNQHNIKSDFYLINHLRGREAFDILLENIQKNSKFHIGYSCTQSGLIKMHSEASRNIIKSIDGKDIID